MSRRDSGETKNFWRDTDEGRKLAKQLRTVALLGVALILVGAYLIATNLYVVSP